jgi:hypothetical protein
VFRIFHDVVTVVTEVQKRCEVRYRYLDTNQAYCICMDIHFLTFSFRNLSNFGSWSQTLSQKRSGLVDLINCQSSTRRPQHTPQKAGRVIRNLHICNIVHGPNHKPRAHERGQTGSIPVQRIAAESSHSAALSHDAGQYGDGKQGHLLIVVALRVLGALVLLEAAITS